MWLLNDDEEEFMQPSRGAISFCLVIGLFLGLIGWGLWALAWRALEVWG